MNKIQIDFPELLKKHELKVTDLRILILNTINQFTVPFTPEELYKKIKKHADKATAYRTLNTFEAKGIVRKLNLIEGKSSFEFLRGPNHNHYVVCRQCQFVEPIDLCFRNINVNALNKSKKFKSINDHKLLFNGTCKKCVRKVI